MLRDSMSITTSKKKPKNVISCLIPYDILLVRLQLTQLNKDYNKTEDHLKALQSVGQIIGEVLKQLDQDKCKVQLSWILYFASYCQSFKRSKVCRWSSSET